MQRAARLGDDFCGHDHVSYEVLIEQEDLCVNTVDSPILTGHSSPSRDWPIPRIAIVVHRSLLHGESNTAQIHAATGNAQLGAETVQTNELGRLWIVKTWCLELRLCR